MLRIGIEDSKRGGGVKRFLAAFALGIAGAAAAVRPAGGEEAGPARVRVAEADPSCETVMLEIAREGEEPEYALAEWFSAAAPEKGEALEAALDYGAVEARRPGQAPEAAVDLWVEEFYHRYGEAFEAFSEKCL
jgi:hypothetical protein